MGEHSFSMSLTLPIPHNLEASPYHRREGYDKEEDGQQFEGVDGVEGSSLAFSEDSNVPDAAMLKKIVDGGSEDSVMIYS